MRISSLAAALAALVVGTSPAAAVDFSLGAVNSGPQAPTGFGSLKLYADFNSGAPAGLTGGGLRTGSDGTLYAAPYGDTTQYYSVGPDTSSPATLAISGFDRVSLYWGSMDYYNTLTFLGAGGSVLQSFTGSQLIGGTPMGAQSRTVTFTLNAAEAATVTGIQFSSTANAFEFDNLAIGSSVPEPAGWLTMMLGVGLIGGLLRGRRRSDAAAADALAG